MHFCKHKLKTMFTYAFLKAYTLIRIGYSNNTRILPIITRTTTLNYRRTFMVASKQQPIGSYTLKKDYKKKYSLLPPLLIHAYSYITIALSVFTWMIVAFVCIITHINQLITDLVLDICNSLLIVPDGTHSWKISYMIGSCGSCLGVDPQGSL